MPQPSHPASKLVSVSDISQQAAAALAAEHGIPVRSIEDVLADTSVDAVLIATSTDTHSDLIERATAAGKAVLCEKPVDLSLECALACQAQTAAHGRPIMIGFNRRFDPNFAALKAAAVDAGEIGKPELLAITSFDPAPPPVSYVKVSGGLFRDMMIHDFDMACWIMGSAPQTVTAVGSSVVDAEIGAAGDVDTAVTLSWADGRLAVIKNSRRAGYGYDQRLELLGSGGLLQADNVLENTLRKIITSGAQTAKPLHFFLERYMRAYQTEWSAFVDAIQSGQAVPVSLADGIAALACAEAAILSRSTSQSVALTPAMLGR